MAQRTRTVLARSAVLVVAAGFMMAPNCAGAFKACGSASSVSKTVKIPASMPKAVVGGGGAKVGDDLLRLSDDSIGVTAGKHLDEGVGTKIVDEAATTGLETGLEAVIDGDDDELDVEIDDLPVRGGADARD